MWEDERIKEWEEKEDKRVERVAATCRNWSVTSILRN